MSNDDDTYPLDGKIICGFCTTGFSNHDNQKNSHNLVLCNGNTDMWFWFGKCPCCEHCTVH